jgi:molybdate transport system regulatory protein
MSTAANIKLKIQLMCGDEIAMGPGKADLLDAIRAHGSISAAGRAMEMSYRRAWLLVDAMNRCWQGPLVETSPGSSHGGGARVTPLGEAVLAHYRALQARLTGASDCPDEAALAAAMLAHPRISQKA